VRRSGTTPEEAAGKVLNALKLKFRRGNRGLPGSPDFANRAQGWALFVHGCYWHHHAGCSRATIPKNNGTFWKAKFADNRRRDARAARALRAAGFRVVTVWECQTRDPVKLTRLLSKLQRG
jgi:DNA mismatch endonuclease (patch repair protein)